MAERDLEVTTVDEVAMEIAALAEVINSHRLAWHRGAYESAIGRAENLHIARGVIADGYISRRIIHPGPTPTPVYDALVEEAAALLLTKRPTVARHERAAQIRAGWCPPWRTDVTVPAGYGGAP